ncbi:MAG: DMT family transporter [Candidatus Sericytochromatia bacterium]
MNEQKKAYIQIHICVFLWGFTAILGKLITLRELPLVWLRVLITCISLLFFPKIISNLKKVDLKNIIRLSLIGCLICIHWICFYGSIKYSNVSVALSCLSTASLLTSFVEPLVFKQKIKSYQILLGLMVIPGIYLIFFFTSFYLTGIILGILAALTSSIFTILNKKMVSKADTTSITFIELGSGFLFLSLIIPFYLKVFPDTRLIPTTQDLIYMIILSLACTTLPFMLSLKALKHISAFASTFAVNLEPIYGIILAIIIFKENKELNTGFYLGTLIILSAIFSYPILKRNFDKKTVSE